MSPSFRFREFEIQHEQSTMKVGTDAIVLGSWLKIDADCKHILDVGCGSGVLALMLAQRTSAKIHAIDIDEASVLEADLNFKNSPWKNQLKAFHCAFQNYLPPGNIKYDLIVSNPPFFQNSLLPRSERLRLAKHNIALTMPHFVENVKRLLNDNGRWAVILPLESFDDILMLATQSGFRMTNRLNVIPKTGKPVKRIAVEFCRITSKTPESENLVIRDDDGAYSKAYKFLTQDYHAEGYL